MSAPCKLNALQRAFMRDWLTRCITSLQAQPPSDHRGQSLALLREQLERYREQPERPALQLIRGGLS